MGRGPPVDVAFEVGDRLPAEGRRDRPGLDQHDGDARAGELDPQGVDDALERELGRDIGAAPRRGDEAEHRGGEDQPPAPGGAHRREQAVGQVDLAEEVGLEDRPQRLPRQVLDGAGDREGAVVEDRVDAARAPRERLGRPFGDGASSARSRAKLSRPSARSCAQSASARQVAKTRQPRAASVRAASRPIPEEQPVMRIVRAIRLPC